MTTRIWKAGPGLLKISALVMLLAPFAVAGLFLLAAAAVAYAVLWVALAIPLLLFWVGSWVFSTIRRG